MKPKIIADKITLIDNGLMNLPEYGATYVVRGSRSTALIEVGTSLCVPNILQGLAALEVAPEEVTHILCTHVHLDHAGAAGHLLEHMPNARVVIHSRVHRHLVEPSRLVAGVAAAVGPLFALYGEVRPISPERLLPAEELRLDLGGVILEAVPSPGHSRDHVAYLAPHAGILFSGDSAGVSVLGGSLLRPVTAPSQFDMPEMLASLAYLRTLQPALLCFTHFGPRADVGAVFDRLEEMLRRWDEIARTRGPREAATAVYAANMPPAGVGNEEFWKGIAEVNRKGFLMGYGVE